MIQWFNQLGDSGRWLAAAGLALAMGIFGTGCADRECEPSSFRTRCDGDKIVTCDAVGDEDRMFTESDTRIETSSCGDGNSCVEDHGAVCLPLGVDLACDAPASIDDEHESALATGDVDGDGHPDVLGERSSYEDKSSVALFTWSSSNGSGSYPAWRSSFPVAEDGGPVTGDFDGDGRLDVAYVTGGLLYGEYGSPAQVVVLFGDGRGHMDGAPLAGSDLRDVARVIGAADIDGDGATDVVIATGGVVSAWSAKGRHMTSSDLESLGTSVAHTFAIVSGVPQVGTMLLDGERDVLYAYPLEQGRSIHTGHGDACPGSEILSMASGADLDGDGAPDVVVRCADGTFATLLYRGDEGFVAKGTMKGEPYPLRAPVLGELTGDAFVDVVDVESSGVLSVHAGRGDGTFDAPMLTRPSHEEVTAIVALDRDGRGHDVVALSGPGGVRVANATCGK